MFLYFSQATGQILGTISGMWQTTAGLQYFQLKPEKTRDAITIGATTNLNAGAGSTSIDRVYFTPPLAFNQVISGRVSGQLMVREYATTDNVDRVLLCARVLSKDGSIVRGTLINSGNYGSTLEFVNNATHRNKTIAQGQDMRVVTGLRGDRLVFEIGYQNSTAGTTPQASAKWGTNAPILPINETQTTDGAGWIQITNNLKFAKTSFVEMDDF